MPSNGRWDLIRRLKVKDTSNHFLSIRYVQFIPFALHLLQYQCIMFSVMNHQFSECECIICTLQTVECVTQFICILLFQQKATGVAAPPVSAVAPVSGPAAALSIVPASHVSSAQQASHKPASLKQQASTLEPGVPLYILLICRNQRFVVMTIG